MNEMIIIALVLTVANAAGILYFLLGNKQVGNTDATESAVTNKQKQHKADVRSLAIDMRKQGLSLRQTSEKLFEMGHKNKNGGRLAISSLSVMIKDSGKPTKKAERRRSLKSKSGSVSVLSRPNAVKLREWRKEVGLSQVDLAEMIGEMQGWHISHYELLKNVPEKEL
jgi:ribosome-binding protein aMBF1 (putative translation factor)